MQLVAILILALAVPFFLWFPERILGLPYLFEEAAKLFLVSFFPAGFTLKRKIILAVCLGIFFTLSEQVLYIFNLSNFGQSFFFKRLIIVGFMHCLTFVVIVISGHRKKSGLWLGFILACLIHFFFNRYISLAL